MINLHVHTPRCGHAVGSVEEMVSAAREAGLEEIGFADHGPLPEPLDDWHMGLAEFPDYKSEIEVARSKNAATVIRFGIEADYLPQHEDFLREFLGRNGFDYAIASVHYVGKWNFDRELSIGEWDTRRIDDVYVEYFGLLRRAVELGLFQIVGHLDLPKKFGHRASGKVWPEVEKLLQAVKEAGMAVELNTSGLRAPVREAYPEKSILRRLVELCIPVTLGTDAHEPRHVAWGLDWAVKHLFSIGVRQIVTFEDGRLLRFPIGREWQRSRKTA